ncbi:MAG: GFA family protein [Pseudomonadota bacterium]
MEQKQSERRTGKCLCGAVSFEADIANFKAQACHCKQCQQWTGGGPLFVVRVQNVDLEGAASITSYRASAHGERSVCDNCGSTLFWNMQGEQPRSMALGLFEDQSGITIGQEIFVDQRPDWLPPFEGATQSTEADELAKLKEYLEAKE